MGAKYRHEVINITEVLGNDNVIKTINNTCNTIDKNSGPTI